MPTSARCPHCNRLIVPRDLGVFRCTFCRKWVKIQTQPDGTNILVDAIAEKEPTTLPPPQNQAPEKAPVEILEKEKQLAEVKARIDETISWIEAKPEEASILHNLLRTYRRQAQELAQEITALKQKPPNKPLPEPPSTKPNLTLSSQPTSAPPKPPAPPAISTSGPDSSCGAYLGSFVGIGLVLFFLFWLIGGTWSIASVAVLLTIAAGLSLIVFVNSR